MRKELPLSRVYRLIEPGPVVLLTTAREGRANIMTLSWHMMVEFEPPLVACVVSSADYSFAALRTYLANLCPLFWWAELAGFCEDFGEPIRKSIEALSRRAVRQGSTEHLDCVLREVQRINNAIYASAWRDDRCFRVWGQMPRLRAGDLELVLQIVRGNLDVPHGHSWIRMAEEFHYGG
jgi:hypothetical protein